VVVVRWLPDAGIRFLLLRAYRHWDFPKGTVEPGESPLDAAIRETAEETQIDDLSFEWGTDCIETGPYAQGKRARYYLASTRIDAVHFALNPKLGRPEHHEHRWVDLIEAVALASARLQPVLAWAALKLSAALPPAAPSGRPERSS
jgi:8-oxo-dGTP pyrophosphatase MutT (NUDIX family)